MSNVRSVLLGLGFEESEINEMAASGVKPKVVVLFEGGKDFAPNRALSQHILREIPSIGVTVAPGVGFFAYPKGAAQVQAQVEAMRAQIAALESGQRAPMRAVPNKPAAAAPVHARMPAPEDFVPARQRSAPPARPVAEPASDPAEDEDDQMPF